MGENVSATTDRNSGRRGAAVPPRITDVSNQPVHGGILNNQRNIMISQVERNIIREEILILESLLRQKELQEQLMMLEGNHAMRRSEGPSSGSMIRSGLNGNETDRLDERLADNHHVQEAAATDDLPFQHLPGATSENAVVKPLINLREEIVMPTVGSAEGKLSGTKHMIETSAKDEGSDETETFISAKKPKLCLECELCQVKMNREGALEEHLRGKKHLAKASKITTKLIQTSLGFHASPVVNEVEAQHTKDLVEEENKASELNKCNARYWCEVCKVGTNCEENMAQHRKGKKHLALVEKNGGNVITVRNVPVEVYCAEAKH